MPNLISILQSRPASIILLFITGAASFAAFRNRDLYLKCILHPFSINSRKEFYRLLSSAFVHNDIVHLLINGGLVLLICGEFEDYLNTRSAYGSLLFLLVYLLSHFSGATAVTLSNRKNYGYSSAGASGSLLGCMMGFMVIAPGYIAFYIPSLGAVKNEYAALLVIVGLIVYKWRSRNTMLDNEMHFYSALGGILVTFTVSYLLN